MFYSRIGVTLNTARHYDIIERLTLEGEGVQKDQTTVTADSVDHLSPDVKLAWAQLLSSAASAEESEEMVIDPVLKAFKNRPKLRAYLKTHMADEARHQKLLKSYVLNTFGYEKKKKTLTDVVVYKGVFRGVSLISEKRPLPIIVAILFYEWFAEEFYSDLINRAERDGLPGLKNLFAQIEKDELRHRAGIKALLAIWKSEGNKIDKTDIFYTSLLLSITRLDVNTADWAFYNKKLRRNLTLLGLDTKTIYDRSKSYADKALAELRTQVAE